MDNFSSNRSVINISDGIIENISSENATLFVTVSYTDCPNCARMNQTVRLVVGPNTVILNERGNTIPASDLRVGMTINAVISSAMTRSIPPQSSAFFIQIVRRPERSNVTVGRIIDIHRNDRSFTTISDRNPSSIIRFNVPVNTPIVDRAGRPTNFSRLVPGLRVRVQHANFMTASIPPQTTALRIQIL